MSDKLVRIKNRYDTAINWASENPILSAGEIGIDSTYNVMKVGNGSNNWKDLPNIGRNESINFVTTDDTWPVSVGVCPGKAKYCIFISNGYMTQIAKVIDNGNNWYRFKVPLISTTDANIDLDNCHYLDITGYCSDPYASEAFNFFYIGDVIDANGKSVISEYCYGDNENFTFDCAFILKY